MWRDLKQIAVEGLALGIVPVLRHIKVLMPKQPGARSRRTQTMQVVRLLAPNLQLALLNKGVVEELVWRAMASVEKLSPLAVRALRCKDACDFTCGDLRRECLMQSAHLTTQRNPHVVQQCSSAHKSSLQEWIPGPNHVIDVLHCKTNLTSALMNFNQQMHGTFFWPNGAPRTAEELEAFEVQWAAAANAEERGKLATFDFYGAVKETLDCEDIPVCGINGNLVRTPYTCSTYVFSRKVLHKQLWQRESVSHACVRDILGHWILKPGCGLLPIPTCMRRPRSCSSACRACLRRSIRSTRRSPCCTLLHQASLPCPLTCASGPRCCATSCISSRSTSLTSPSSSRTLQTGRRSWWSTSV